ncbi:hypothetical protein [Kibdelosporangium aridum]|uniref:hypothetical protein n=1 Tax=Kibdelosporangium aridum TaxID=2030 RepID=UPI0035E9555F
MTLVMAWIVGGRIRRRLQNVSQGADRVVKHLGENTRPDNSETWVEIWDCHPLTVPMIKELAESKGYRYSGTGFSRRTGAKTLEFVPPKPKKRRLDL